MADFARLTLVIRVNEETEDQLDTGGNLLDLADDASDYAEAVMEALAISVKDRFPSVVLSTEVVSS